MTPDNLLGVDLDQRSYEDLYNQLQEVVQKLEAGGFPLDELLRLFEEGMELTKLCNAQLDSAELRISQLIGQEGDDEPTFEPFELGPR